MFRDRRDAGNRLAGRLKLYSNSSDVLVLALPRGGVVTGFEVARQLKVRIDVLVVRKIGFPGQPELAIGAVSETGTVVLNKSIISDNGVSDDYVQTEIARQKEEISRRAILYRGGRGLTRLGGKAVVLVDDGVATGATIKAAIETLKEEKLRRLVIALPISPPETAKELEEMVDEFICLETPWNFMAVGNYYDDFSQTSDEEVVKMLREAETWTETASR